MTNDTPDPDHIARIHALLNAFAATPASNAHLFLHESRDWPHMADAVIEWARARGIRPSTNIATSHGHTYETWDIRVGEGAVSFFPLKIGLLDNVEDLKNKIDKIRNEADVRIRELVEAEKSKAVTP